MTRRAAGSFTASLLGILAVLFWGTTVAFARSLTQQLGTLTAGASIYLLSGAIGCAYVSTRPGGWTQLLRLPRAYLFGCGSLFVLYMVCVYLALGRAAGQQQAVEVGIMNYLWPGLTLVFSIPVLRKRARATLPVGIVVAFAGVVLAVTQNEAFLWRALGANLRGNSVPYFLALVAAVSWALYSNLSRRWAGGAKGNAVALFLLATGIVFLAFRLTTTETSRLTSRTAGELLYMILFPTLLAYSFWDAAMRRGEVVLVASVSYLTPLLSTIVACLYLGVRMGVALWLACALVIGGAVACRFSVTERPAELK